MTEVGDLVIDGDVQFSCDVKIQGTIEVWNINGQEIMAKSITAKDITAFSIDCETIDAQDVIAFRIGCELVLRANDIKAGNIITSALFARNVVVDTLLADEIVAHEIVYDAVVVGFQSFKCRSIVGQRKNAVHLCLDGDVEVL